MNSTLHIHTMLTALAVVACVIHSPSSAQTQDEAPIVEEKAEATLVVTETQPDLPAQESLNPFRIAGLELAITLHDAHVPESETDTSPYPAPSKLVRALIESHPRPEDIVILDHGNTWSARYPSNEGFKRLESLQPNDLRCIVQMLSTGIIAQWIECMTAAFAGRSAIDCMTELTNAAADLADADIREILLANLGGKITSLTTLDHEWLAFAMDPPTTAIASALEAHDALETEKVFMAMDLLPDASWFANALSSFLLVTPDESSIATLSWMPTSPGISAFTSPRNLKFSHYPASGGHGPTAPNPYSFVFHSNRTGPGGGLPRAYQSTCMINVISSPEGAVDSGQWNARYEIADWETYNLQGLSSVVGWKRSSEGYPEILLDRTKLDASELLTFRVREDLCMSVRGPFDPQQLESLLNAEVLGELVKESRAIGAPLTLWTLGSNRIDIFLQGATAVQVIDRSENMGIPGIPDG